ncbi:MAG: CsbD family protein [Salinivenus sp.]
MDRPKKKTDSPQMQKVKGSWKQFKGHIQEKWGDLTGDEIDQFEGKRERLEGYIQKQTGEKREDVRKMLDSIRRRADYTF